MLFEMKHMKPYESPAVTRTLPVAPQVALLAGSVVTPTTKIETAGQEVDDHSFATGFDSNWE